MREPGLANTIPQQRGLGMSGATLHLSLSFLFTKKYGCWSCHRLFR